MNNIHQMDLVGPRYIKGDGKFYALNVMDLYSHQVYLESQRTKADDQVAFSLMRCWKAIGMPDFLQMDNELSFRGSNRYPRSFGIVLQLCLYYGIQPIFIPVGEPWRNGTVERFNDTYSRKFFRRQWFHSYEALKRQSKNFQRFHNQHHRYSCLKGKTPMEVLNQSGYQPVKLAPNTKMPELEVQKKLSARQWNRVGKDYEKHPEKFRDSEMFKAITQDSILFGDAAFDDL